MNQQEALHVLGLAGGCDAQSLQQARAAKLVQLAARLANAPTEATKALVLQRIDEVNAAAAVLAALVQAQGSQPAAAPGSPLGATMLRDLPSAVQHATVATGAGLSATMLQDLPASGPSATRHGTGGAFGRAAAGEFAAGEFAAGMVIADRFEIRRKLGAGGMGVVYAAFDRVRGAEIALKLLQPGLLQDPQAKDRFWGEAKLTCKLSHPNIVQVFDVQSEGGLSYIAMELLEGRSLRAEMEERRATARGFTVQECLDIASALGAALAHAHTMTVHRDVKPENIYICRDGTLKLLDFGIARVMNSSQMTMTGMAMGTAYYMAPEQLKGGKELDHRADQYSMAVVLHELLTGDIPVGATGSVRRTRKEVSSGMSHAIAKALSSDPGARHRDIGAFLQALRSKRAPGELAGVVGKVAGVAALLVLGAYFLMVGPKTPAADPNPGPTRNSVLAADVAKPEPGGADAKAADSAIKRAEDKLAAFASTLETGRIDPRAISDRRVVAAFAPLYERMLVANGWPRSRFFASDDPSSKEPGSMNPRENAELLLMQAKASRDAGEALAAKLESTASYDLLVELERQLRGLAQDDAKQGREVAKAQKDAMRKAKSLAQDAKRALDKARSDHDSDQQRVANAMDQSGGASGGGSVASQVQQVEKEQAARRNGNLRQALAALARPVLVDGIAAHEQALATIDEEAADDPVKAQHEYEKLAWAMRQALVQLQVEALGEVCRAMGRGEPAEVADTQAKLREAQGLLQDEAAGAQAACAHLAPVAPGLAATLKGLLAEHDRQSLEQQSALRCGQCSLSGQCTTCRGGGSVAGTCGTCKGTASVKDECGGCDGGSTLQCGRCRGSGSVRARCDYCSGRGKETCSGCKGRGRIESDCACFGGNCSGCAGRGMIGTVNCFTCGGSGNCGICRGTRKGISITCFSCSGRGEERCDYCNGSGEDKEDCDDCNSGRVDCPNCRGGQVDVRCERCESGRVAVTCSTCSGNRACSSCGGDGRRD